MKVLWLANIPSPYRVKFFNELGKYCELTVLFEKYTSSERDDSWKNFQAENFTAVFLKGKSVGVAEAFCPSVVKYLTKRWDHIVVTNSADPTGILAITYMRAKRIPYEIEGDGAFPGNVSGIKATLKRFLFTGADCCFSTARLHDEYYLQYGVSQSKIVRYPFSSVYEKDVLNSPPSQTEKMKIRRSMGITDTHMVLAVGQFIHRKGFDLLIQAAAQLDDDYGVYIVGGKPTEEYECMKEKLPHQNVHFIGFMQPEELGMYYQIADVFVHPTREDIWGLVINEAMAKGLPVVTTNRCIAGLEMIQHNKNGIIVEVDNVEEIAKAIQKCISQQEAMGTMACKVAMNYTIEQMAKHHLDNWKVHGRKDK